MQQIFPSSLGSLSRSVPRALTLLVCAALLISCAMADEGGAMSSDTPATTAQTEQVQTEQAEPAPSAPAPQPTSLRPRDGDVAIREEFANAVVQGEVAAFEMFIRRHPDHALAEIAQIILARGLYGPPPARD